MKYFHRVIPYLLPYKKLAWLSVALILLGAIFGLLTPWPLKILIDHVLEQKPMSPALAWVFGPIANHRLLMLFVVALTGLIITLMQNAITVLHNYASTKIDQRMVLDFRSDLMQHAQRLSLAFHNQRRTGHVIFAINNMGAAIAKLVMIIPPLAESFLTLLGMFCIVFLLDWQLALISLSIIPFLYVSVGHYMKRIHPRLREVRGMEGEMLSKIHETITMLPVVMAFGREDYEYERFREHGEQTVDKRVGLTVRQTIFSLGVNTITAAGTALVLGFGGWHVVQGILTTGDLMVVLAYIAAVYKPLERISTTMGSIQEITVGLEAAFNLLDTEVDIKDAPNAIPLPRCEGSIEFQNINFAYKERRSTLEGISFAVKPGQLVGLVGPTGAGKTTLVSLMPRFFDPDQGSILVDEEDVRKYTLASLRSQFSIVLQEPVLFSDTIAENIRYGKLDASEAEIIEAAEAANAHAFISRLPQGYETKLGERGAKLSGGERQRIAVARAFLRNSPFLILDEPTSSVDTKTEQVILDALKRLMAGRTTFMIAHRLSTLMDADLLLVLQDGRIVERGTHSELINAGGLYQQLHDAQMRHRQAEKLIAELPKIWS